MSRRPLQFDRPLVSVDLAIFTLVGDALQLLLVKRPSDPAEPFPGAWALPGGFIDTARDASLEACARRKLLEKTGVSAPYLEQVGGWGDAKRDPRGWSVTHLYIALVAPDALTGSTDGPAAAATRLAPVEGLGVKPRLAFDHARLLEAALKRLRAKVEYTSLPAYLLPESFTLPQLQRSFEIVLGRALDKSAFRTRVLSAELVEPIGAQQPGRSRPAELYRLKQRHQAVFFPRPLAG